jgi:transcription antitermination factor NusG
MMMNGNAFAMLNGVDLTPSPATYSEPRWYAAYTCANHEKRVAQQLDLSDVEHFLPLYTSVRRWKDRRVTLELPLFPGYVFVRMPLGERMRVMKVPGVAHLVGFSGTPAALPEGEIEALRKSLGKGMGVEPHPYLIAGRHVRLKSGPLAGVEGVLVRRKGNFRVVISIDLIQRSVAVDADVADIEPSLSPRSSKVLASARQIYTARVNSGTLCE